MRYYDYDRCLQILVDRDDMRQTDAIECMQNNVVHVLPFHHRSGKAAANPALSRLFGAQNHTAALP